MDEKELEVLKAKVEKLDRLVYRLFRALARRKKAGVETTPESEEDNPAF